MRHIKYLNSTALFHDAAQRCTHVLIGQRNEALEPKPPEPSPMTTEAHKALLEWVRAKRKGRYAITVLAWAQSEEAAEAMRAEFPDPTWINLRVEPVSNCLG